MSRERCGLCGHDRPCVCDVRFADEAARVRRGDPPLYPCPCGCEVWMFSDLTSTLGRREVDLERIRTLASNLAVAGALCAAFELGCLFGGQWMARDPVYPTFEPGCRSRAPSGKALAALQQKVMDALTACGWPSPVNRPAPGYINKESSVKVYKYEQYFGRMGSLSSVFAARDEDIKRLKKRGRIYLGEVLGKHSEVTATISDETLRELTADPAVVSFFTEHLGGCSGTDLIGHMDNEESEDDDEEDDDE